MAREPELSIKVKVDPQIKPSKLKTDIEGQIKKSGEKPQIDIDPNVDGIKRKVEDKLKNIKATANITPIVNIEKLKTDIQQQINGISDIPNVTVGVNVNDFSDELSKRLKEELKSVNDKLSYYLKNLTTNTAGLNSVVEGLFPSRGISNAVQSELKSVQAELTAGLKDVKSKVKPFKETDLFQIGDTASTTTIRRVEKLVKNIREQFASFDNFYDADEEKFLDGFNSELEKFQNNASETVEKLSALKNNLSKDRFSDLLDNEDFDAKSTIKALTPLISFLKKLSTTSIKTGEDYDNLYALFNNKNTNKLFDESSDHLTRMKTRVGDITAETKTAIEVTGELAKTLNKAIKDDNSGYLSDAEIKTYGAAFDEVLSDIASKYRDINQEREKGVGLENNVLKATRLTRNALSTELKEYEALFKKFDTDKIAKFAETTNLADFIKNQEIKMQAAQGNSEKNQIEDGVYNVKDVKFDIDPAVLQLKVDETFKDISAPIDLHLKKDAAKHVKDELNKSLNESDKPDTPKNDNQNNANDVVPIHGKVTITDADVVVDVKNPVAIPGTVTVNPTSVQFGNSDDLQKNASALSSVKQSLSKISTSAEGYGTKIAAIGPSVQYVAQEVDNLSKSLENQITDLDLIAKKTDAYGTTASSITLNTKDVAVAGDPINVPVKATLKKTAITVPEEAIDIKVKGVLAPEDVKQTEAAAPTAPVDIPGKVELKDEDIKRPNPLNLNGAVKIKAADVKIDDVEISKKKFDIKGNLILKNAEIVDAVKEAVGKESKNKNDSESTQKATATKEKPTSRRGLISELITVNKKIAETKNMLDDVSEDEVGTIQKHLENLRANRDEIVKQLNDTNTDNDKWYVDRKFRYANKEVDYTRLRHADSKSVKESQENIQAAQNERDKYNNEKLSAYRAYRSEQNTYKLKKARLGEDEKSDEAIAINNAISELDTKKKAALNSMKLTIQEHADLLDQMGKEDNEVEEKVNRQISIIKGHESNKNKVAQTTRGKKITDQLSAAQKTYGTEEEANATGKIPTSVQKALSVQQQLVDKIAKAKIGTEEYNNAIQAAEENWKSVVAIIDTAEKKQKDLTKAVDSIEKKFYQLAEEVSGSSNEKLKNSINGVITKAATLSAKNQNTYENYAVDYNELKRESYKANAQYTIWKSNYKKLEREGIKIAEGVEVARQMQADGSLQNVKFDGIDNLLKQLNELEPQTDAYKEKLVEVKKIWEEIERKVKAVEEAEKQAAKKKSEKTANLKSVSDAISQNRATMKDVQKNYGTDHSFYGKLQEKDSKLKTLLDTVDKSSDPVSAAKEWAQNNLNVSPDKINSVKDAINQLHLAYREATQEAKDFNKEVSREKSINKASMEVANLKSTIHDYIAEHKKLEGTNVGKSLYELLEALNQSDAPEKIGELKKKYAELRAESKKLGLESKNLLDVFEKLFGQHLSTMITMAALHQMQNGLRVVYQNVVEIDTAMTELRKVTNETDSAYAKFMENAADRAQRVGATMSDTITATADFARLGYSLEDASSISDAALIYKNVGDGISDISTASESLISTMQAFNVEAKNSMKIVDEFNEAGNNFAISSAGVGEALQRSGAALASANNTMEQSIALATTMNRVVQNPEIVGTTLKTVSMYLRSTKADLEAAGESTEGMAETTSKLRDSLKALSHGKVDIFDEATKQYKSTTDIIIEMGKAWDSMSDKEQAAALELMGGKRNANALSSLIENYQEIEKVIDTVSRASGSAESENQKYLSSINGRLTELDSSFQVLSQDVLSSDLIKGSVFFLTSIVKLLDQIVNLTGALPLGLGIGAFVTQLGEPKMTGFMIVPSNTPGGDTEQARCSFYWRSAAREYLVKPTNMVA